MAVPNPPTLLILVMLIAVPFGGCLDRLPGRGDDEAGPTAFDGDDEGNETGNRTDDDFEDDDDTGPPANETDRNRTSEDRNMTRNMTGGPANQSAEDEGPEWKYDNRSGDVSGPALVVTGPSSEEPFMVDNGTLTFLLELNATDDLTMTATPPGCEEDACRRSVESEAGAATLEIDLPEEGEWMVELSAGGVGFHSVEYELGAGLLVET